LKKINYSDFEIQAVNRLVAAADDHKSNKDDEAVIVDADSLSKLCIEHLQEKYQPESFANVIDLWENELTNRIKTDKAKELFSKLLNDLKQKIG
jgi:hypothetical protein